MLELVKNKKTSAAARARQQAEAIERYWRRERRRTDVVAWVEYDKTTNRYEVRSNLINGLPPSLAPLAGRGS